jgi:hypothetical protein
MKILFMVLFVSVTVQAQTYVNGYYRGSGTYVNSYVRDNPSPYGANNYGNSNLQQPGGSAYDSNSYYHNTTNTYDNDNSDQEVGRPYRGVYQY